jgi:hypothetical protein
MRRRDFLQLLGAVSTVGLAGCLGDDSDDGGSSGDGADGGLDGKNPEQSTQVVERFFEAWANQEPQEMDSLVYEDGDIRQFSGSMFNKPEKYRMEIPRLEEAEFCEPCSEGSVAVVNITYSLSSGQEYDDRFYLEWTDDEQWRISSTDALFARPPEAEIVFEEGDGTLTVVHDSGDGISADRLYVRGDAVVETGVWYELSSEFAKGDTVTAGDSVTVEVEDSYTANVVWKANQKSNLLASVVEH